MKSPKKSWSLVPVLVTALGFLSIGRIAAQPLTTLHAFSAGSGGLPGTNNDGFSPYGALILSGNTVYGTAESGGTWGSGLIFAMNADGTGFTNVYSFSDLSGTFSGTNADGATPNSGLILSGDTLYGSTVTGGVGGNGTVFSIKTDGTGFTNLHNFSADSGSPSFTNSDGASPYGELVLSGGTLYGTAVFRGPGDGGTIFAIQTNGTGFRVVHGFTADSGFPDYTNYDGKYPYGGLVVSSNTLYGTTLYGGSEGAGVVFAINTEGTGFTNLHSFTLGSDNPSGPYTNADGNDSYAKLLLVGKTLYGTASAGGIFGYGTIFAIDTGGSGFTNVYNFTGDSDNAFPADGLTLSGNTFYGTTTGQGAGTVFAVNIDGTAFKTLHSFAGPEGNTPNAVTLSGNTLYGTAFYGGNAPGYGTVFSLAIPIALNYQNLSSGIVLSWDNPTNVLQAASAMTGAYTNVPGATSPYTNAITGQQRFFRLSGPR